MVVVHLHINFGADIFIQSGVIVIFPKFKMAVGFSYRVQIFVIVTEIDTFMLLTSI